MEGLSRLCFFCSCIAAGRSNLATLHVAGFFRVFDARPNCNLLGVFSVEDDETTAVPDALPEPPAASPVEGEQMPVGDAEEVKTDEPAAVIAPTEATAIGEVVEEEKDRAQPAEALEGEPAVTTAEEDVAEGEWRLMQLCTWTRQNVHTVNSLGCLVSVVERS